MTGRLPKDSRKVGASMGTISVGGGRVNEMESSSAKAWKSANACWWMPKSAPGEIWFVNLVGHGIVVLRLMQIR